MVLSGFGDPGRVWAEAPRIDEIFTDLHRGDGSGPRLGMAENFTIALDAGTTGGGGLPIYMGLGYLF